MIKTVSQRLSKDKCSRVNIKHSPENTTHFCHDEKVLDWWANWFFSSKFSKERVIKFIIKMLSQRTSIDAYISRGVFLFIAFFDKNAIDFDFQIYQLLKIYQLNHNK